LIKILLVGEANVGKSSLMLRFIDGEFKPSLVGTAGIDYKQKVLLMQGHSIKLQVWDTAG
jgi:small GTP-binding protein